jgi:hypothetical protein
VGATLLLAPSLARLWIGAPGATAGGRLLVRALGARDLALAVGLLLAVRSGGPARGWAAGGVVADGADLVGTLLAGDELPRAGRLAVSMAAGSGVAVGAYLAARLPSTSP